MKKGYKIVDRNDEGHLEPWSHFTPIYAPLSITEPHRGYGPLCVFDTIEHALRFVPNCIPESPTTDRAGDELWECVYTPASGTFLWHSDGSEASLDSCPAGTVLATHVMLTRRVLQEDVK